MTRLFSLQGKVAIITGGNSGIGLGIARALAEAGGNIIIAARDRAKTEEAAMEIKQAFGVRVFGVEVDVGHEDQIKEMVRQTVDSFRRVDVLINNAGMTDPRPPQDYTAADWDSLINVNLRGAFLCAQAVYPAMKAAGGGKIVNIGSLFSRFGGRLQAVYGAGKGGLVGLTRNLAVAWAPDNIQVNTILPGWIRTGAAEQDPDLAQRLAAGTPAGRWGEAEDLAGAAVFLSSAASNFITGVTLPVDGGFSVSPG